MQKMIALIEVKLHDILPNFDLHLYDQQPSCPNSFYEVI